MRNRAIVNGNGDFGELVTKSQNRFNIDSGLSERVENVNTRRSRTNPPTDLC